MTRKTTAPTIEQRVSGVAAVKEAALSVFEQAAADLDEARDEAHLIAATIADEIARLMEIADEASAHAADAEIKASKIRAIFA